MDVEGFTFDAPPGFRTETVTVSMRMATPGANVSPSLVIQSKRAREGATLNDLAVEAIADVAQSVPNIKNASQAPFEFADGGAGVLLSYSVSTHKGELRQYFAMRLDHGRLCCITLTVPTANLTAGSAQLFVKAIQSVKPGMAKP
jgi:hypothetical protein